MSCIIAICIQEGEVTRSVCSFSGSIGADIMGCWPQPAAERIRRLRTNAYAIIREAACPIATQRDVTNIRFEQ